MPSSEPILAPVVALVLWTCVMLVWMAAKRLPAIAKLGLGPEAGQRTVELGAQLPKEVQWAADNYNHLMEQPTIFYATALVLALAGSGDGLNLQLAWAYVGLRVVHSIVQATVNPVALRFGLFAISSGVLLVLAIRAALSVF